MSFDTYPIPKFLKRVGIYFLIMATCLIIAFPIYWLCNCSFQKETALFSFPPSFFPKEIHFGGYLKLFVDGEIWRWIVNTAYITMATVLLTTICSTLGGYGFSRFKYRGRSFLSLALLSTQMISGPMVITPLFIVFSKLGLINTFFTLIITDAALCMAVSTWLMKGFFDSVPVEIEEAAMIDGCNRMQTLWRVTLPISMTGLVTVLVMTFFITWNEYLYGLIFISDQNKWVGSVGLGSFIGSYVVSQEQILAGATLFSIVPVLFFVFFQRFIILGATQGAVKG